MDQVPSQSKTTAWVLRGVQLTALLTALLGAIVIVGWLMRDSRLVQIVPGYAHLQFNAALCFLISGVGLLALTLGRPLMARACGVIVGLFGVVTFAEYVFGVNLGIDRLFMTFTFSDDLLFPGRMGKKAALAFSLAGLGLLYPASSFWLISRPWVLGTAGAFIAGLGAVILLGYVGELTSSIGWGISTGVAVHAGFGMLAFGAGLLGHAWQETRNTSTVGTRWIVFPVACGLLLFTWNVSQSLQQGEDKFIQQLNNQKLVSLAQDVKREVMPSLQALVRMGKRWELNEGTSKAHWQDDATYYIRHDHMFQAIKWVDSALNIRWIVSKEGYQRNFSHHIGKDDRGKEILQSAIDQKSLWISHPITLAGGDEGILVYQPLFVKGRSDGFLLAVFGFKDSLGALVEREGKAGYAFTIFDGEKKALGSTSTKGNDRFQEISIELENVSWTLRLWPTDKLLEQVQTGMPEIAMLLGLLLTGLVSGLVYVGQGARIRAREVSRKNVELEQVMAERARIQEDLDEVNQQHRLILDSVAEGIYGLDLQGRTTFLNPSALEMIGGSQHEIIGKPQHDLIHHTKPDGSPYPKEDCPIYKSITEGTSHRCDADIFWRNDGTSFPVEYLSVPTRDEQQQVIGAVVTFLDITKRKQAEEEVNAKNKELETLLYVTSHDLREPLRGIESFANLVQSRYADKLDEKGQDFLARIVRGAQRLNTLLNDVLALSRIRRIAATDVSINGREVVDDVLQSLRHRIEETGAVVRIEEEIPQFPVEKTWITQVIFNLVGNALKFTANGHPPDIEIAPYHSNGSGPAKVGIVIRDRGLGVPEDQTERIFQLFQRAVGREVEGTGAGLAIVRQIAERYGGWAWVQPREGGGSEFIVTFSRNEERIRT